MLPFAPLAAPVLTRKLPSLLYIPLIEATGTPQNRFDDHNLCVRAPRRQVKRFSPACLKFWKGDEKWDGIQKGFASEKVSDAPSPSPYHAGTFRHRVLFDRSAS